MQDRQLWLDLRTKKQKKYKLADDPGKECCVSPALFNIYVEKLIEEGLEESIVGCERIRTIKYAGD